MGINISGSIDRARHPERYPDRNIGPTFDPVRSSCLFIESLLTLSFQLYGFPDGRKVKGNRKNDYSALLIIFLF